MFTPISWSGAMPTKSASGRLTRRMLLHFVMHDDEVADGVENFDPVAVRLLHAGKQAGVFESDAGMAGDGAQQLLVFERRGQRRDPPDRARR